MKRAAPLAALTLAALALRVLPWLANLPLHHDEALYGTWAARLRTARTRSWRRGSTSRHSSSISLALAIRTTGVSELSLRLPACWPAR